MFRAYSLEMQHQFSLKRVCHCTTRIVYSNRNQGSSLVSKCLGYERFGCNHSRICEIQYRSATLHGSNWKWIRVLKVFSIETEYFDTSVDKFCSFSLLLLQYVLQTALLHCSYTALFTWKLPIILKYSWSMNRKTFGCAAIKREHELQIAQLCYSKAGTYIASSTVLW